MGCDLYLCSVEHHLEEKVVEKLPSSLYENVRSVLSDARKLVHKTVNFTMVQAYWTIGKLIVEYEQNGEKRAEYGKGVLENLASRLTQEFGKGYDVRELRRIRQFFIQFPIWDALRPELQWTHYRLLVIERKSRT